MLKRKNSDYTTLSDGELASRIAAKDVAAVRLVTGRNNQRLFRAAWQQIEKNWTRFKQAIGEKWGKLTEDDLEAIAGRRKRLEEALHTRYGFAPDHVRKEVDDWLRWQTSKARPTRSDRAN